MPDSPHTMTDVTPIITSSGLPDVAPQPPLVGHSPTGRLVAQRGLFRGPDLVCPLDLYAAVVRGDATRERHRLVVHPHSTVTTVLPGSSRRCNRQRGCCARSPSSSTSGACSAPGSTWSRRATAGSPPWCGCGPAPG